MHSGVVIHVPAGGVKITGSAATFTIGGLSAHAAVLAFIDILGFRSLVQGAFAEDSEDRETLATLAKVLRFLTAKAKEERERLSPVSNYFQTTAFSDTIVISDEDTDDGYDRVADSAASVAASLLWRGHLCRGGIARGSLIHTQDVLLGPALIEAYDIEQKAAVFPRIVVAESLTGIPPKSKWKLRREADGLAFIDVFHRMSKTKWNDHPTRDGLLKVRNAIEKQLRDAGNSKRLDILSKYRWIAYQFNEFATEQTAYQLEPISIG